MTVPPLYRRTHLVPALLSAAIVCVLLACPAIGKQPAGAAPPGQAKQAAKAQPHGHAKRAGGTKQAPGQARKAARERPAAVQQAPGQARKGAGGQAAGQPAPGQAKKAAGQQSAAKPSPGQAKNSGAALSRGQTGKTAARGSTGGRGARASAAGRRGGPAASRRRTAAARRRAAAATAGGAAVAGTAVAGAGAAAPQASGEERRQARTERRRHFAPVPPRDELPQPFRVVRDIVHVVPTPLRVLIAGLVALAILLAGAAGFTLLRNRRLARQRSELLGQVGLLQAALLPDVPDNLGAFVATVAYRPADGPAAGGDFYDIVSLAGGETAVIMGDVSGHGRDALGRTALVRYTLRAYVEAGMEPQETLQMAGSVLAGKLEGDFVTALVGVHDAAAGTLTYAAAGHPPPIVVSREPFKPVLAAGAPPLGIGAATGQRQTVAPFPRGSIACFYTDGLSEARMASGRLVGAAGLERVVRSLGPGATADQVIEEVAATARRIADDAAACVISAEGGSAIVRSRVESLEVTRTELRGPLVRQFLEACGVSTRELRAAEQSAREMALEAGGAILEVRMGERAEVEVRRPELPSEASVAARVT